MTIDRQYADATVRTADNLGSIARLPSVRELTRLTLPEIEAVFARIVEAWADRPGPVRPLPGLTVKVQSFSYRQGIPDDDSGHGGGFVFDCRALPNPGRYPQFAGVTGRDDSVIAYLEAAPETEQFWQNVLPLVENHVRVFRQQAAIGHHENAPPSRTRPALLKPPQTDTTRR